MFHLILLLINLSLLHTATPNTVQVKKADIELNQRIVEKNVINAREFYAEDFILTTSSGKIKYKQDMLNEIASTELSLEINETQNAEVRLIGSTAVLTGTLHQKGIYKGKSFDVWLQVTDTWVRTSSGWKILSGHYNSMEKNS
jgi:hypothetical protein